MSRKVDSKRVIGVPTSPLTDYSMPVKNMDQVYGKPGFPTGMGRDPLAQFEMEQAKEAIDELRDLKAKKKRIELQHQIEQEKENLNISTSGGGLNIKGIYNFSAQDIAAISAMPDGDKQGFFDTLQKINAMSAIMPRSGVGGGMNPMLQFMAMGGFGRQGQGQGLGLKDVVELQKTWQTIYQGAGKGNQELTNSLLLKLITETVPNLQNQANSNLQMAYNAQIAHLQANQSDPSRDIRFVKELATELNWKPGGTSDGVEMKRLEMENLWKQKDWEFRMMEHRDRRNLGIVDQILTNAKDLFKRASRENIREMVRPQQEVMIPPPTQNVQPPTQFTGKAPMDPVNRMAPMERIDVSNLKYYNCQGCGIKLSAPSGVTRVLCPSCGAINNVTG